MDEEMVIKKGVELLIKGLGPIEALRFMNFSRERKIDSVKRHRAWQKTLDPEFLADKDNLYTLGRETQEQLRLQAVEWLEKMEPRRAAWADLITRLEDVIAHPNT